MLEVGKYSLEELSEKIGVDFVGDKNRSKRIRDKIKPYYEYSPVKEGRKVVGIEITSIKQEQTDLDVKFRKDKVEGVKRFAEQLGAMGEYANTFSLEELALWMDTSESSVRRHLVTMRELGYLTQNFEKVQTTYFNKNTGEWEEYQRDINDNVYYIKCHETNEYYSITREQYAEVFKWHSEYKEYHLDAFKENYATLNNGKQPTTEEIREELADIQKEGWEHFVKMHKFSVHKKLSRQLTEKCQRELGIKIDESKVLKELENLELINNFDIEGIYIDASTNNTTINIETLNVYIEQPKPVLEVHWSEVEENIELSRLQSIIYESEILQAS